MSGVGRRRRLDVGMRVNPGFVVKAVVAPAPTGGAPYAGRRLGDAVAGGIVGSPFTSGQVVVAVTLERGTAFGAGAGVLAGGLSRCSSPCLLAGPTALGAGRAVLEVLAGWAAAVRVLPGAAQATPARRAPGPGHSAAHGPRYAAGDPPLSGVAPPERSARAVIRCSQP